MKIALVTIQNANNYGAVLQAFAMQEVLKRYGDVEIINYENRHISRSFDLVRLKPSFHGLLGTGKDVFRLLPRYRAIKKFRKFIDENLNLTVRVSRHDVLSGKVSGYDVYVAGSDQIWNPLCVSEKGEIDRTYFLDFPPVGAKKISFASSVGGYNYSADEMRQVKQLLSSFSHLAVREKPTKESLENLLGRPVKHVLDPTLLLDEKEWLDTVGVIPSDKKMNYILLYTVPKEPSVRSVVDFFAQKLGLEVVSLDQGLTAGAKVNKQIRDAGPKEFIELFANARFVITDSFHGTCFALNFNRPFVAISPSKHSNRIESLLNLVGLEGRLVKPGDELEAIPIEVNMKGALDCLNAGREESLHYIESSLR